MLEQCYRGTQKSQAQHRPTPRHSLINFSTVICTTRVPTNPVAVALSFSSLNFPLEFRITLIFHLCLFHDPTSRRRGRRTHQFETSEAEKPVPSDITCKMALYVGEIGSIVTAR
ncbi:unnamed protein product [Tenebrio molitor]|nr:unnamed protein product [Tenebrio molitor]